MKLTDMEPMVREGVEMKPKTTITTVSHTKEVLDSVLSNSRKIDPRQSINRHMSKRAKYSSTKDPAVKDLQNTLRKISGGY